MTSLILAVALMGQAEVHQTLQIKPAFQPACVGYGCETVAVSTQRRAPHRYVLRGDRRRPVVRLLAAAVKRVHERPLIRRARERFHERPRLRALRARLFRGRCR